MSIIDLDLKLELAAFGWTSCGGHLIKIKPIKWRAAQTADSAAYTAKST